jgi:hypothetical protein
MKRTPKTGNKKLGIATATIRALQPQDLEQARGGLPTIWYSVYYRCSWENCL